MAACGGISHFDGQDTTGQRSELSRGAIRGIVHNGSSRCMSVVISVESAASGIASDSLHNIWHNPDSLGTRNFITTRSDWNIRFDSAGRFEVRDVPEGMYSASLDLLSGPEPCGLPEEAVPIAVVNIRVVSGKASIVHLGYSTDVGGSYLRQWTPEYEDLESCER